MTPETSITDWIAAGAAVAACVATTVLAIIAWKQAAISDRQTAIIGKQTDIFERQAFYQGQQTTISKSQTEISKRQTDISGQQLAIIKGQETDRKNAAMSADLGITSIAEGENVLNMILENKGSGWAREIQVYLNGHTLSEYPPEICRLVPESVAQNEIGPRNKLNYFLEFPGATHPTNLRVDIKWVSDNGIRGTNLGFINPRQQLEVYKKEHLNVLGTPKIAAEVPKEMQVAEIKKQLLGYLDRYNAEWTAERKSDPYKIDNAKRILLTFGHELLEFRSKLSGLEASDTIISKLDELLVMTKTIQKQQIYADGGVSARKFWELGTDIFTQAKYAIESIQ